VEISPLKLGQTGSTRNVYLHRRDKEAVAKDMAGYVQQRDGNVPQVYNVLLHLSTVASVARVQRPFPRALKSLDTVYNAHVLLGKLDHLIVHVGLHQIFAVQMVMV
jgi:hypothetical protein